MILSSSELTLEKGQLLLRSKGQADQRAALKNTVSALRWTGKSWELHTLKTSLAPDPKILPQYPASEQVFTNGLKLGLSKGSVKWAGISAIDKSSLEGALRLPPGSVLLFHGDEFGSIHMIPDCGHLPIGTNGKRLHILDREYASAFMLGLVPTEEGASQRVAVCSGVGVAIDIIDNIVDPNQFYSRMRDQYFNVGDPLAPDNDPVDAATQAFCSGFDSINRPWAKEGEGYYQCYIDLNSTSLYLNCRGEIVSVEGEHRNSVSLGDCPLIFAVHGDREIMIASQDPACLSALGCR